MGVRNYLVEGVSCSGKTAVATELESRGHHVVHGARPEERPLVLRVHGTREDLPDGVPVDATRPLAQVVDEIERLTR